MATCPTDSTSYFEEIKTFVFRGVDGITIPKSVRQEAYVLAVDIVIRSIARESYVNYNCMPPESFFGNATVVMQDALELKIPVKFPRQRLYYGRVPEAFEQWNAVVNFDYMKAYFAAVGDSLASLGTALGVTPVFDNTCCSLPQPSWQELPLREVYFYPPIGTQYELEVTWTRPVAFSDSCDTFYDGYSRQIDGDKDSGLPPNGIFPNIAEDENDPYSDLPPETPDSEQLEFSNSKSANLDDIDPENEPQSPYDGQIIPPAPVYWLKLTSITRRPHYSGGCSGLKRNEVTIFPLIDSTVRVEGVRTTTGTVINAGCGDVPNGGWQIRLTGGDWFLVGNSDSAPTFEYKAGATITDSDTTFFN